MENRIPSFLLSGTTSGSFKRGTRELRVPFLERGIDHLAGVIRDGYAQRKSSSQNGLFQRIDARVKVLFLVCFIVIVSLKREVLPETCLCIFVFGLALSSRLSILKVYRRVLFLGFVFGFLVALPSAFNVITGGEIIYPIVRLEKPHTFWIYHLPAVIGLTREGINGVAMLTLRVINSLSLSFLVLYTTPFHEMVRALKVLRAPDSFLMIITLCYKYIFIFSKTVEELHLAKKSRVVREVKRAEAREWIVGRLAFLFRKSRLRCEEVFKAMIGRGFSDSIKVYGFRKMRMTDWCAAIFLFFSAISFFCM